ncbi:uncharacterized protein LOC144283591 isoform X2 [Canis aureus]
MMKDTKRNQQKEKIHGTKSRGNQTLDNKICGVVIPEEMRNNLSPVVALAYCLKLAFRPQHKNEVMQHWTIKNVPCLTFPTGIRAHYYPNRTSCEDWH